MRGVIRRGRTSSAGESFAEVESSYERSGINDCARPAPSQGPSAEALCRERRRACRDALRDGARYQLQVGAADSTKSS
jgi:hypothetical protein